MDKFYNSNIDALVSELITNQNSESEFYRNPVDESTNLINDTTVYNQVPVNAFMNNLVSLQNPQSNLTANLPDPSSRNNLQTNLSSVNYSMPNMAQLRIDDLSYSMGGYSSSFNTTSYVHSNLNYSNLTQPNTYVNNLNYNRNAIYLFNNSNNHSNINHSINHSINNQNSNPNSNSNNLNRRPLQGNQQSLEYSRIRRPIQSQQHSFQQQQRKYSNNTAFNKLMNLACGSLNPNYSTNVSFNRQSNCSQLNGSQSNFNGSTYNMNSNQSNSSFINQNRTYNPSSQNCSASQCKSNASNELNNERTPCLRSIRASRNKVVSKLLSQEIDASGLIEQIVENLVGLKSEILNLEAKLSGKADESCSSTDSKRASNVQEMIDLSLQEFTRIDNMFINHETFFDTFNDLFQTSFCTFQIWFNLIQVVKYASNKAVIKLCLDDSDIGKLLTPSADSNGTGTIVDNQLYNHIYQLLRCTREVRTSIWCIFIIASSQQINDLPEN